METILIIILLPFSAFGILSIYRGFTSINYEDAVKKYVGQNNTIKSIEQHLNDFKKFL